MGLTDPDADRHRRHTMVLVPRDTPGVKVERMLSVMGMHDEPHGHGEVSFTDVRVPLANVLLGPGRAFEIAQGRLGPGRVHHCMRLVGLAEMALELAVRRATDADRVRPAAGQARRQRASGSPTPGSRSTRPGCWCCTPPGSSTPTARAGALSEVSQIKVAVPNMAQQVIDMAMQMHGGGGLRRGAAAGRGLGRAPGRCGWPTAPTRCTAA